MALQPSGLFKCASRISSVPSARCELQWTRVSTHGEERPRSAPDTKWQLDVPPIQLNGRIKPGGMPADGSDSSVVHPVGLRDFPAAHTAAFPMRRPSMACGFRGEEINP
jgi:hypothetical protein